MDGSIEEHQPFLEIMKNNFFNMEEVMSTNEKVAMLEEVMDLDEGALTPDTVLDDLDEWDSLSMLSLIAMAKIKFNLSVKAG